MPDWLLRFITHHPWWGSIVLLLVSSLLFGSWAPGVGGLLWMAGTAAIVVLRIGVKGQAVGGRPQVAAVKAGRERYARIVFQDLHEPMPDRDTEWYLFRWALPQPIAVGQQVFLEGGSTGIVVGEGRRSDYDGNLSDVLRIATLSEVRQAYEAHERGQRAVSAALNSWLDLMRSAAGLPVSRPLARRVPDGMPIVPPADGEAGAADAERFARSWWKAFKNARDSEEEMAFEHIARRWYARRDAMEMRAAQPAALARGRHYTEWVEPIKQMKRDGRHNDALTILGECMDATERADRGRPAPWYYEQAAIIYRKDRDLDAEHAVIERYFAACEEEPHEKMVERRQKVQQASSRAVSMGGVAKSGEPNGTEG